MSKTITWVLERYLFEENEEDKLIREVRDQGCELILLDPLHIDTLNPPNSVINKCRDASRKGYVIFRGSFDAYSAWVKDQGWNPGVIYDSDNFRCSKYYPHWYEYLLNKDYRLRRPKELMSVLGTEPIFLRPDSGSKDFSGKVFTPEQAHKLLNGLDSNVFIVSSPVKELECEVRFVISTLGTPHVITYSPYKGVTQLDTISKLLTWVEEVVQEVHFHPDVIYLLDVCVLKGSKEPRVVELNGLSCGDWYQCGVKNIVAEVIKYIHEH